MMHLAARGVQSVPTLRSLQTKGLLIRPGSLWCFLNEE